MKLSTNLTFREAIKSITASRNDIKNEPNETELLNMFILANNCFQPIRDHFSHPIYVSSFFRSLELNKKVGGSTKSDHIKGCAIDLDADVFGGLTNSEIFFYVLMNLEFKTLIWEHGDKKNPDWVHISYQSDHNHIKNVLMAKRNEDGKTVYSQWR